MFKIFDCLRDINFLTVIVRLIFSIICGGAIGLERSYKNRPAGFRTHILVCIGATIACMTGIYLYVNLHFPTDISRLGAQVVSGLGFIGGGTIIVINKKRIKGLTTAAGLWTCGVIGLAIGAGFYEGALIATVLVLIAEIYFSIVGSKISHNDAFGFLLLYDEKEALNQVMRYCKDHRMMISNLEVTGKSEEYDSKYSVILTVRPRKKVKPEQIIGHIRGMKGISGVREVGEF
ncbi:MAG: MgtC/SapB family protein [Clostridiales bacterium]|nr:MgtC/SapB family protein [Clostridiales bacterium]